MERLLPKLVMALFMVLGIQIELAAQSAFDKMSNTKMEKILFREAQNVERMPGSEDAPGRWQFTFMERMLYIITDEAANRMRVMTRKWPILIIMNG